MDGNIDQIDVRSMKMSGPSPKEETFSTRPVSIREVSMTLQPSLGMGFSSFAASVLGV